MDPSRILKGERKSMRPPEVPALPLPEASPEPQRPPQKKQAPDVQSALFQKVFVKLKTM